MNKKTKHINQVGVKKGFRVSLSVQKSRGGVWGGSTNTILFRQASLTERGIVLLLYKKWLLCGVKNMEVFYEFEKIFGIISSS